MPLGELHCLISHAELTHTSRCLHKGPCIITGFAVTGYGGTALADLYDGESALGEHKCRIQTLANTTFDWPLPHPVDFDKGIYVKVSGDHVYVTICYVPESWKKFF